VSLLCPMASYLVKAGATSIVFFQKVLVEEEDMHGAVVWCGGRSQVCGKGRYVEILRLRGCVQ